MSLERIAKLLNMAENAATEAEADAFMDKAESLAATYSVDLAVARAHTAETTKRQTPEVRTITVGERGRLRNKGLINLWSNIAHNYNIKTNIAHNSTYVVAFGFATDIDLVEALWSSLAVQMVAAGDRFIRSRVFENETKWDERTWTHKPVSARGARQAFHDAFGDRIGQRIFRIVQHEKARKIALDSEQFASSTPMSNGTEIALRAAELEVKDFYAKRSNARGTWRGHTTARSSMASAAGRRAGDEARIGSSKAITAGRMQVTA